ncbi:MAG: diaminopimelate epimerase [Thermoleophilia bacterium]|nr:diaminopimelate epimerase [Thermoleophilia bacterium]
MANPHFVTAMEPESVDLPVVGRAAENHGRFPERANIEFIRMNADDDVTMRVWERGAGETLACGTGACAVGVSAILDHGATSPLTVHLRGGDLTIEVDADLHVFMTGPAEPIFSTDIDPASIEQPAAIARRHERARA